LPFFFLIIFILDLEMLEIPKTVLKFEKVKAEFFFQGFLDFFAKLIK